MQYHLLKDLPTTSSSRTGWPWTEASPSLPKTISNGQDWPRISIITPSYNQGQFIEETIRSVLLQGYPNLEYIIIDGGSTDNSVDIIKRYQNWLTYWISEPDRGQTHAINKGLGRATGDLIAYLNSDDYYLPGTLAAVARYWRQWSQTDLIHGRCRYVNVEGIKIGEQFASINRFDEIIDLWGVWWRKRQFVQPEVFWTRRITDKIGPFREDLYYVMDYDYWSRILQNDGVVGRVDAEFTCFRFTPEQKSNHSVKVADELLQVVEPLIWDPTLTISRKKRLELQGKWLYQVKFLSELESSLKNKENKWIRWFRLLFLLLHHPQIFMAPFFQNRLNGWLSRLSSSGI